MTAGELIDLLTGHEDKEVFWASGIEIGWVDIEDTQIILDSSF
jgi:hypothetical protein